MTPSKQESTFEGWAVLEVMGHRRLVGLVSECTIAGAGFLRIDIPGPDGGTLATQFYPPSAVFCLTPTTEEIARKEAERSIRPRAHVLGLETTGPSPADPDDEVPW